MNRELSVRSQIEILSGPRPFVRLVRPCIVGDGIIRLSEERKKLYAGLYEKERKSLTSTAFIPASGAASRMFMKLFEGDVKSIEKFANQIKKFAFFDDLKDAATRLGMGDVDCLSPAEVTEIVLSPEGLGYANAPKGLVKFHKYGDISKTAFEEHIALARRYADGIHFTVSESFPDEEKNLLSDCGFAVSFSSQSSKTDTVALDSVGGVLTDENGKTVFRPSGHGALLENFSRIESDIVFISNIDNIARRENSGDSFSDRKALAGMLIENMREIPRHRPLRVCGVVENTGESGGGPFWVYNASGGAFPRIVESAEIDHGDPEQEKIWRSATHFNPVDMVCSMKDVGGEKFCLESFSDNSFIVTDKTSGGRPVKVLEMPGLWNGAMAGWDTVFMEIKPENFNPVKNVFDLLNVSHQDLASE